MPPDHQKSKSLTNAISMLNSSLATSMKQQFVSHKTKIAPESNHRYTHFAFIFILTSIF